MTKATRVRGGGEGEGRGSRKSQNGDANGKDSKERTRRERESILFPQRGRPWRGLRVKKGTSQFMEKERALSKRLGGKKGGLNGT